MKTPLELLPLADFWRTRKHRGFWGALIAGLIYLLYELNFTHRTPDDYRSLLAMQIGVAAILLSITLALMGFLISSNSHTVQTLRRESADSSKYRPLAGQRMSLFQTLLSDVVYSIVTEIFYLAILLLQIFDTTTTGKWYHRYWIALDIFSLCHIVILLLGTIVRIYLSFWNNEE